jgi:8-oxo-dGTP pyrophosphatase MutT (NUDIX family)
MYKVFIDHKPVIFIHKDDLSTGSIAVKAKEITAVEELKDFLKSASVDNPVYLTSKNPKKAFKRIFEEHKKIEAAGGIVQRKKSFLVIKRNGLWDIPKGKIDKGEAKEHACVREIMEECGIDGHTIVAPLVETYHTMKYKGDKAIKKTYWFMLEYTGPKETKPETKEGITKAKWMSKEDMLAIRGNTYGSINDVLDAFVEYDSAL